MGELQLPKSKNDPLFSNNSKSFANRYKLIIRNNLDLCKLSEIYLRTFKNIVIDLIVQKYRFGKEKRIKQINDIRES